MWPELGMLEPGTRNRAHHPMMLEPGLPTGDAPEECNIDGEVIAPDGTSP